MSKGKQGRTYLKQQKRAMSSPVANETRYESELYPSVQEYFEKGCHMQCWSENDLRTIQKRGQGGRYVPEQHPIPDLVAADSSEIIAVEIKSSISPYKLDECIGKLVRMLRFANKVYAAFPRPIPESAVNTFRILRQSVPQIGLLEIRMENTEDAVKEMVPADHGEPPFKSEWGQYSVELMRAKALSKRKQFRRQFSSELISDVVFDPERNIVTLTINDPMEDEDLAEEVINTRWIEIDEAIYDGDLRTKFGEEAGIELVSDYWEICQQCQHIKGKEFNCPTCHPERFSGPNPEWGSPHWWERPLRNQEDDNMNRRA